MVQSEHLYFFFHGSIRTNTLMDSFGSCGSLHPFCFCFFSQNKKKPTHLFFLAFCGGADFMYVLESVEVEILGVGYSPPPSLVIVS